MKKLCIIDQSDFTNNPVGGSTTFLRTIIPELAKYFSIYLMGSTNDERLLSKWSEGYLGCARFYGIGRINQQARIIPNRVRILINFYRCRNEIVRQNFDMLYLHQTETVLPFIKFRHIKKILHIHGLANPLSVSRFPVFRHKAFRFIFDSIFTKVEQNLALLLSVSRPNPSDANELRITRTDLFHYVPVCIDASLFAPIDKNKAKQALGIDPRLRVLGFVGRLNRKKGIENCLEVTRKLREKGENVCFVVVGDGEHGDILRSRCKEMAITESVHFVPAQKYHQLPAYYSAMDIFLMASEAEGFPMVIVEAMACGIPVVSTNVGAVANLVVNGVNGYVTGENFVDEACHFTEKIFACHEDMAARARDSIAPYRAEVIAKKVAMLLENVSGGE